MSSVQGRFLIAYSTWNFIDISYHERVTAISSWPMMLMMMMMNLQRLSTAMAIHYGCSSQVIYCDGKVIPCRRPLQSLPTNSFHEDLRLPKPLIVNYWFPELLEYCFALPLLAWPPFSGSGLTLLFSCGGESTWRGVQGAWASIDRWNELWNPSRCTPRWYTSLLVVVGSL